MQQHYHMAMSPSNDSLFHVQSDLEIQSFLLTTTAFTTTTTTNFISRGNIIWQECLAHGNKNVSQEKLEKVMRSISRNTSKYLQAVTSLSITGVFDFVVRAYNAKLLYYYCPEIYLISAHLLYDFLLLQLTLIWVFTSQVFRMKL